MRLRGSSGRAGLILAASLGLACGGPDCQVLPGLREEECEELKALLLPEALPGSPENPRADDVDAALLGFAIFYDARFSSNLEVRCATCHIPEARFSDGRPVAKGLAEVERRTPSVLNAARMRTFMWDGAAASLVSQPLLALEDPREMGFTRLEVAHRLARSYRARYEKVFGPLPPLEDAARFPSRGKPGDAAFDAMAPADQEAIDRIATHVGQALEAYQRRIAAGRSALDRFLLGDPGALTATQREGLAVFLRARCAACHGGPMLSDQRFHNLGVPAWPGRPLDAGRAAGLRRSAELYGATPEERPEDLGAFRTPSLRNVALTPPYGHNGRFSTLEEVVRFHLEGGGRGRGGFLGEVDPLLQPIALSAGELEALLDFLSALTGEYPRPPWNDWPQR